MEKVKDEKKERNFCWKPTISTFWRRGGTGFRNFGYPTHVCGSANDSTDEAKGAAQARVDRGERPAPMLTVCNTAENKVQSYKVRKVHAVDDEPTFELQLKGREGFSGAEDY